VSGIAPQPLSQRIVPALHVSGFTRFLANLLMGLRGKSLLVGAPEIAVGAAKAVGIWNLPPQSTTGVATVIPYDKFDDLACAATHHCPKPTLIALAGHKRPGLIDFQHTPKLDWQQGFTQPGKRCHMVLNPAQNGLTMRAKDTLYPAQADPLSGRPQHLLAKAVGISLFGFQDTIDTAIFAMILPIPALIRAISDKIGTAALITSIRDGFLYHAAHFIKPHHLPFNHYRLFHTLTFKYRQSTTEYHHSSVV